MENNNKAILEKLYSQNITGEDIRELFEKIIDKIKERQFLEESFGGIKHE